MSTTVNVRVDKSRLTQQLKDNSAATQQQAAQKAVDEAAAEQVRANNEARRRRQQDANAKFRKSRHDPTARRDGGQIVLPDGTVIETGALINVARVGLRRNTEGTKIFVYSWGAEAALQQRLSADYDTAVYQAGPFGVELEFKLSDYPDAEPALPSGNLPPNATKTSAFSIENRGFTTGFMYDVSPAKELVSYYLRGTYYLTPGGWGTLKSEACYTNAPTAADFPPPGNYPSYSVGYFYLQTTNGAKSQCETYGVYPDENPGNQSYTVKTMSPVYAESATPAISSDERIDLYQVILPAGGQKALYVVIARRLKRFVVVPHYLEYEIRQTLATDRPSPTFALPARAERFIDYDSDLNVISGAPNWDAAIINEVRCVLVDHSSAKEVPPSPELITACNKLVAELDPEDATGITPSKRVALSFDTVPSPAFEVSNFSKAPYYSAGSQQQVLSTHLGLGYLETSNHSGRFVTPVVYEWFAGQADLTSRYDDIIPAFYSPGDDNSPFPGVYLSVTLDNEAASQMRATATQPIDISTRHTAPDWVTVETGSRYGDYLVWDWGNPEYCQQRLQALGMNV